MAKISYFACMAKKKLTDKFIESLKPNGRRQEYCDTILSGFGIVALQCLCNLSVCHAAMYQSWYNPIAIVRQSIGKLQGFSGAACLK